MHVAARQRGESPSLSGWAKRVSFATPIVLFFSPPLIGIVETIATARQKQGPRPISLPFLSIQRQL